MSDKKLKDFSYVTRFTEKELAEYWNMSSGTLANWRSLGCGPVFVKVGGKVVYRREDIERFEKGSPVQLGASIYDEGLD